MAYPRSFGRLVVSGTLYSIENFSFSLSVVPNTGTPAPLDAAGTITAIAGAVSNYWGSSDISFNARLTTVKYNEISPDGTYASSSETNLVDFPTPVPGSNSSNVAPQIALAVSLLSNSKRGLAHQGRFYLPVPGANVGADGRIGTSQAETYANNASAFLNVVNDAVPAGWAVGIASNVGAGAFKPCIAVRVGRVLDTIRSRRSSLPELYEVADAAVG